MNLNRIVSVGLIVLLTVAMAGCGPKDRPMKAPRPPKAPPRPPAPVVTPLDLDLAAAASKEIYQAFFSADPIIRAHAIEALRQVGSVGSHGTILKGLDDKASVVRFASAMAVGELKLKQAHDKLLQMVDTDPSRDVQVAVRFALHRIGDKRLSHDLEKAAMADDRSVRANTAVVLGLLEEPSAQKILRAMVLDRDPAIRLMAAESLWRLGDERGLTLLVAGTVSMYPDDQMISYLALAAPRNTKVIEHVRGGLVNDYTEVSLVASRAMGMLGSDEGYVVAMNALDSADPRHRALAALALGAIGRSDAQDELKPLLTDPNPDVRLSAATAILQLKKPF